MAPDPVDFCIAQDMVAVRPDPNRVYPLYLFAALRSRGIQDQIEGMHVGTMIPHFKKGDFDKLLIPIPAAAVQKFIGDVYFLLSEKMDHNRRMNQTLETLARALFKSWFVDFDPVVAKAAGKQPVGMSPATATRFPDRFSESQLGPIPAGWRVGTLGDVLDLKRGYDLPQQDRQPGSVPVYTSSGLSAQHAKAMVKGPGVVTGRYGTIGDVFFVDEDFWPHNTTLYVRDFKGNLPHYCYQLLQTINFGAYTDKAAVPGVNRNHLHHEPVVVPPLQIQQRFEQVSMAIWRRRSSALAQSLTLASLRDALPPRLLSGALRVRQAEKLVEANL